jgi:hypothetical protein
MVARGGARRERHVAMVDIQGYQVVREPNPRARSSADNMAGYLDRQTSCGTHDS